jgi:hypothetical protein
MAREIVAQSSYGGAWTTWRDAARHLAVQLRAAGYDHNLLGIKLERPPKDGDRTKLIAYREVA